MPASLYDFRDLDLLLKIAAESNGDGWLDTQTLAESLGFEKAAEITARLNWMRHYGMLEFDQQKRLWQLTSGAERVTQARLKAATMRTITDIPDEAMVEVMANVTARYRLGAPMTAQLLRREFLYGTKRQ